VRHHPVRAARTAAENNRKESDEPGIKIARIANLSP
jgi:hypothetical protein